MHHLPLSTILSTTLAVTIAAGATACGGNSAPTAPTSTASAGAVAAPSAPTTAAPGETTAAVLDMMARGIADEYHAQAIYNGVLQDFGPVRPFVNIVQAEGQHAAAIAQLYAARGLVAPANGWTVDMVPRFASVAAACTAAAEAEVENVRLYDEFLAQALPTDVRTVFENNRRASINNHLPAFQGCS